MECYFQLKNQHTNNKNVIFEGVYRGQNECIQLEKLLNIKVQLQYTIFKYITVNAEVIYRV